MLLTAAYVRQQYKGNILLPLHGNNVYAAILLHTYSAVLVGLQDEMFSYSQF